MSIIDKIWADVIRPSEPTLAPDVTDHFLFADLTDEERAGYQLLATKDPSLLTETERSDLTRYHHAIAFLSLMREKSRASLADQLGMD
jgi:hypothetical protein